MPTSRKGNPSKGGQKYQNKTKFVVHAHDQQAREKLKALPDVFGTCARCKEKIEWRRLYGKYKMLKEAAKCNQCQKRTVKEPYRTLCNDCSSARKVCPACCQPGQICQKPYDPDEDDELQEMIKHLSERQRRAVCRRVERGLPPVRPPGGDVYSDSEEDEDEEGEGEEGEEKEPVETEEEKKEREEAMAMRAAARARREAKAAALAAGADAAAAEAAADAAAPRPVLVDLIDPAPTAPAAPRGGGGGEEGEESDEEGEWEEVDDDDEAADLMRQLTAAAGKPGGGATLEDSVRDLRDALRRDGVAAAAAPGGAGGAAGLAAVLQGMGIDMELEDGEELEFSGVTAGGAEVDMSGLLASLATAGAGAGGGAEGSAGAVPGAAGGGGGGGGAGQDGELLQLMAAMKAQIASTTWLEENPPTGERVFTPP